jgi:hypothetical protein
MVLDAYPPFLRIFDADPEWRRYAKSTQIFRKLPNPYSLLLRQAEVDSNPSSEERL